MKVLAKNWMVWPTHLPIVTTDPLQPDLVEMPVSYIRVLPRDLFNEANLRLKEAALEAKTSAITKLKALGLTDAEIAALVG